MVEALIIGMMLGCGFGCALFIGSSNEMKRKFEAEIEKVRKEAYRAGLAHGVKSERTEWLDDVCELQEALEERNKDVEFLRDSLYAVKHKNDFRHYGEAAELNERVIQKAQG